MRRRIPLVNDRIFFIIKIEKVCMHRNNSMKYGNNKHRKKTIKNFTVDNFEGKLLLI